MLENGPVIDRGLVTSSADSNESVVELIFSSKHDKIVTNNYRRRNRRKVWRFTIELLSEKLTLIELPVVRKHALLIELLVVIAIIGLATVVILNVAAARIKH